MAATETTAAANPMTGEFRRVPLIRKWSLIRGALDRDLHAALMRRSPH
jgi:hypothetical protein